MLEERKLQYKRQKSTLATETLILLAHNLTLRSCLGHKDGLLAHDHLGRFLATLNDLLVALEMGAVLGELDNLVVNAIRLDFVADLLALLVADLLALLDADLLAILLADLLALLLPDIVVFCFALLASNNPTALGVPDAVLALNLFADPFVVGLADLLRYALLDILANVFADRLAVVPALRHALILADRLADILAFDKVAPLLDTDPLLVVAALLELVAALCDLLEADLSLVVGGGGVGRERERAERRDEDEKLH